MFIKIYPVSKSDFTVKNFFCWVEKKYEIMPGKVIALQDICSIKDAFFKEVILEK